MNQQIGLCVCVCACALVCVAQSGMEWQRNLRSLSYGTMQYNEYNKCTHNSHKIILI